jgi:hypothetical protein
MTQSELKELEHMKVLLRKWWKVQLSTVGDSRISMEISTGGYLGSMSASVFLMERDSPEPGRPIKTVIFYLSTFQNPRHNENICNGCIAFINAHRTQNA